MAMIANNDIFNIYMPYIHATIIYIYIYMCICVWVVGSRPPPPSPRVGSAPHGVRNVKEKPIKT